MPFFYVCAYVSDPFWRKAVQDGFNFTFVVWYLPFTAYWHRCLLLTLLKVNHERSKERYKFAKNAFLLNVSIAEFYRVSQNSHTICAMAAQLADRGPNLDLRSGYFRPRPTIGLNSDLHSSMGGNWLFAFSTWRAKSSPHLGEDFFSLFGHQIAVKIFWTFPKFSQPFLDTTSFSSAGSGLLLNVVEYMQ